MQNTGKVWNSNVQENHQKTGMRKGRNLEKFKTVLLSFFFYHQPLLAKLAKEMRDILLIVVHLNLKQNKTKQKNKGRTLSKRPMREKLKIPSLRSPAFPECQKEAQGVGTNLRSRALHLLAWEDLPAELKPLETPYPGTLFIPERGPDPSDLGL